MNKILFITNIFSVLLIILINQFVSLKPMILNINLITLVFNVLCLFLFIYLFFYRRNHQRRVSSLFFESKYNEENFDKLSKKVRINEGKYIFYLIWGASIDYSREDIDRPSDLDKSNNTEDLLD